MELTSQDLGLDHTGSLPQHTQHTQILHQHGIHTHVAGLCRHLGGAGQFPVGQQGVQGDKWSSRQHIERS